MSRVLNFTVLIPMTLALHLAPAHAARRHCRFLLERPDVRASVQWAKKEAIDKTLSLMAVATGLPKWQKLIKESRESGSYKDKYANFGEMGLAEIGISVRYNRAKLGALDTGRPLIIVANHHLGIADGLAMQYLSSRARPGSPSLLFLARWIEKLLPHAVYGDEYEWGTAIPVEINLPKVTDPHYDDKMTAVKNFNLEWRKISSQVLREGGALIFFPAGHVASINPGDRYPRGVYDASESWQGGFLTLARRTKADIVFADVHSVNRKAFYRHRKRLGGSDKERVIWFFNEALAKKGKAIDVYLSKPMSLDEIYGALAQKHLVSIEDLKSDPGRTAEFMRQFTYGVSEAFPQELDVKDSPVKKMLPQDSTDR